MANRILLHIMIKTKPVGLEDAPFLRQKKMAILEGTQIETVRFFANTGSVKAYLKLNSNNTGWFIHDGKQKSAELTENLNCHKTNIVVTSTSTDI